MNINEELQNIISNAFIKAKNSKHEYIMPEHVVLAALDYLAMAVIMRHCKVDIDSFRSGLIQFLDSQVPKNQKEKDPIQTVGFQEVWARAFHHIQYSSVKEVDLGEFLMVLLEQDESFAAFYLRKVGVTNLMMKQAISKYRNMNEEDWDALADLESNMEIFNRQDISSSSQLEDSDEESEENQNSASALTPLQLYTTNLTEKAKKNELDLFIEREDLVDRVILVLSRKVKNNPILVGESGVGKTAIAEGLAWKIVSGAVPESLRNSQIYSLNMGAVVAGAKYRGDFEERIKLLIDDLIKKKDAILFIDETHTIVGAGAVSGGSIDASNLLKPVIAKGAIRCMGATTYDEYKRTFSRDKALARRFQKIDVVEPSSEETLKILEGIIPQFEAYHQVKYLPETLNRTIELSNTYLKEAFQPDKSIDVIDEAGAFLKLMHRPHEEMTPQVTKEIIEKVVAKMARIPEIRVTNEEQKNLFYLEEELKKVIFGQDEAIESMVNAVKRSRAGFTREDKPVASVLFVGPTGVGKTELSKQLASCLGLNLIRFDMSEYQEKQSIARFIGAPPGYVGYEEGGQLTDRIRKEPNCLLLLDEIEKAHSDIYNVLLQIMDYATLTDNAGEKADFRNVILIMTSNVGAKEAASGSIGFNKKDEKNRTDKIDIAIEQTFAPEFRNRLDKIVHFNLLGKEEILSIVDKECSIFASRLKRKGIRFSMTKKAKEWVAQKGYKPEMGARNLSRVFENEIKMPFIDELLFGELAHGKGAIKISADGSGLHFFINGEPFPFGGKKSLTPLKEGLSLVVEKEIPLTPPKRKRKIEKGESDSFIENSEFQESIIEAN